MARQSVRKLEDKQIGSLGLRLDRVFSQESTNPELPQEKQTLVNQLRWWGESYGFFHRKSDAAVFAAELAELLAREVFAFGIEIQNHLTKPDKVKKWFIDPETKATKHEETDRRGLNLEAVSQFPLAEMRQGLDLPLESRAAIAVVNTENASRLSDSEKVHAGRLISIALNVVILLSGFETETAAIQTEKNRPIMFLYDHKSRIAPLEMGAFIGSAELAKVFNSTSNIQWFLSESDQSTLASKLSKLDQKLLEYSNYLYTTYGVYNDLMFGHDSKYPNMFLPELNQEPEAEVIEQRSDEIQKVEVEVQPAKKEEPDVQISPVSHEIEAKQVQTKTTQANIPLTKVGELNSTVHRFKIGKAECVAIVEYSGADVVGLDIFAHKVAPVTVSYLGTVSAFSTKLLKAGSDLEEVGDLLVDIIFEPFTSESMSILDYVGKWIKSL